MSTRRSAACVCTQRLGQKPPAGERLGGPHDGGGESLHFAAPTAAEAGGELLEDGVGDQLVQPEAVLADALCDSALGGQRLVEQHPPGAAILVHELKEGVDACVQRLLWCGGLLQGAHHGADERLACRFHARLIQPLLVSEVVVEQRLGDAHGGRDFVHRDGAIAAFCKQGVCRLERLLHACLA